MPDFALGLETSVTKDTIVTSFLRASKEVNKFGKTADRSFDKANRAQKNFTDDFTRSLNRLERRTAGTGKIIGGILGADLIRAGLRRATTEIGSFITEAGRVEDAIVGFQTLTKSMVLGKKVVQDLRQLGPVTPFEFKDLIPITDMIFAMGSATADNLIPTLRTLGDTARGSADRLRRIAFAYGEVIANTKATFQEVRQFTNAGVPLLTTITKMWRRQGESIEEVNLRARKMIRAGKLTATVMKKAFKIMTSEGGTFYKGMERASKTFLGRLSTLRENIDLTRAEIGLALLPAVKEYVEVGIEAAKATAAWAIANKDVIRTKFVEWVGKVETIAKGLWPALKLTGRFMGVVADVVEFLAPVLPILAAGWLLNKIALQSLLALEVARDVWLIVKAVRAAAVEQGIWNATMLLNPIGLVVTAVIAGLTLIGVGIFLLVKHWDFLVEKALGALHFILTGAKKQAAGLLRILIWPFQGLLRGVAFIGEKIGKLLGKKSLQKEFAALSDIMDELDLRLRETAGQLPVPVRIPENFVQTLESKFGGIIPIQVQPKFIGEGAIDFARLGGTIKTGIADSKPVSDKLLSKPPALESFLFQKVAKNELIQQFIGNTETPFTLPAGMIESFNEERKIIEHRVKLDLANAPKGSRVSFQPGSQAPPIDIELLGVN